METLVTLVAIHVLWSPLGAGAPDSDPRQISESAKAVLRLSTEFESAQRRAFEGTREAKSEAERKAANRGLPDRREYARRFLDLARKASDSAAAVDALVWVVRNGARTPEGDEAVRKIAEHHLQSDRIAPVCHALGVRGASGEGVLRRILEENASPGIRGRACLALAFAQSLRLREVTRGQDRVFQNQPDDVEARKRVLQERKAKSMALAADVEQRLRQVLGDYPGVLLEEDVTESFGVLANNLGPSAGEILFDIAKTHPRAETRFEAECGLAARRMPIASLAADLRSVASLPPDSKKCQDPALAAACVSGGEARLIAVDSTALVRDLEGRLKRIANRVNDVKKPGICYFHLIMDSPTLSQYHAGTERLLRGVAESHPNPGVRAGARRSLAIYLAGLAGLSRSIDLDRAHWVDRLGEERVQQIGRMSRDRLREESRALAEEISAENREAGKTPDARIEALRKANGDR